MADRLAGRYAAGKCHGLRRDAGTRLRADLEAALKLLLGTLWRCGDEFAPPGPSTPTAVASAADRSALQTRLASITPVDAIASFAVARFIKVTSRRGHCRRKACQAINFSQPSSVPEGALRHRILSAARLVPEHEALLEPDHGPERGQ